MKNLWILLFALAIGLSSCGSSSTENTTTDEKKSESSSSFSTPVSYNDHIIGVQTKVVNSILELSAAMDGDDQAAIKTTYNSFVKVAEDANAEIGKLDCYESDCDMRDAAKNLFKFYEEMAKNEYKKLIDIILKDPAKVTAQDMTEMANLVNAVSEKETKLDAEFERSQKAFASKHGFQVVENDMQQKIDNM
jgi:hypothetical protein